MKNFSIYWLESKRKMPWNECNFDRDQIRISDNHKNMARMIFLHLPRTAGSTLSTIFRRQFPENRQFHVSDVVQKSLKQAWKELPAEKRWNIACRELTRLSSIKRNRIELVYGHMNFGWHQLFESDSQYVTFMRNPHERVRSLFYYILGSPGHHLEKEINKRNLNFENFLASGIHPQCDNGQVRMLSGLGDSIPYGKCSDEHFEIARTNLDDFFSFIGITERFVESILLLKEIHNFGNIYYRIKNKRKFANCQNGRSATLSELNIQDTKLYKYALNKFDTKIERLHPNMNARIKRFKFYNRLCSIFIR